MIPMSLATTVNGLRFPNPFLIASGPPGTNRHVISRAFAEGWGGVIAKTVCLDLTKIVNVSPRYGQLHAASGEVIGWENIELISDRPLTVWLEEFRRCKEEYPDRILIASIMEEYRRDAWIEIIQRCEASGVDGFEINFSCPHGLPERKMGSAMGQDPQILKEVSGWIRAATQKPVWAKLTPNITHIEDAGRAALVGGCDGVSAINTIRSVIGINLDTLRPKPTVEGYTTPGGYSSIAIRPIALRMAMELGTLIRDEFPTATLSGIGGIESGEDAVQFILVGAHTVQVCTGVMKHGYDLVQTMSRQLLAFMEKHGFQSIDDFRGLSLPYFTTYADLVDKHTQRKAQKAAAVVAQTIPAIQSDEHWSGDHFTTQSKSLAD